MAQDGYSISSGCAMVRGLKDIGRYGRTCSGVAQLVDGRKEVIMRRRYFRGRRRRVSFRRRRGGVRRRALRVGFRM